MKRVLSISSQLMNLEIVREFLLLVFEDCNLNLKYFNRVFLGLSEAVSNSIVHGNGLNDKKFVNIISECSANNLFFEVVDEGNGFSLDTINDPLNTENVRKENGRGIFLLRNMADEVQFSDGGRRVMIKYSLH